MEIYLQAAELLHVGGREWASEIGCLTSPATIFQLYMWRHKCAGRLKKKLNLLLGSKRHKHFVGFFNVPVQKPTQGH